MISICLIFQNQAQCQDGWTLKKNKNGIKVFSRDSKNFKFDELKVECEFEGRLSQLAAVLFDVNKQYQWVYKTIKSQLLKSTSPSDVFFYTEIEVPWPFENRDLVVHMSMAQQPASKVLTIIAKNVNGYLPTKKNIVRINYSSATWTATPLNSHRFKVEYRIQVDPGEGVPAWLLNLFATSGPYETFLNLKEKIKLPQYAQAKYSFIAD